MSDEERKKARELYNMFFKYEANILNHSNRTQKHYSEKYKTRDQGER
jgi:hypothetical protein